jgi:hypothetical protein
MTHTHQLKVAKLLLLNLMILLVAAGQGVCGHDHHDREEQSAGRRVGHEDPEGKVETKGKERAQQQKYTKMMVKRRKRKR